MKEIMFRSCRVFKALGNPIRYQLFRILGEEGEGTSNQFAERLGRTQSNVSQHLSKLKKRDLISSRREEQNVIYSIKRPDVYNLVLKLEKRMSRTS